MTQHVLPLADARALVPVSRRTTLERVAMVVALVGCAAAAALFGRHPELKRAPLVPAGTDGIVVLDLSASISSDTYERIGATLDRISRSDSRVALVVFSDVAYEALPPGTRAVELRPFVRYFTLPKQAQPGFLPQFPKNPWADTFSAGTRISTGLELARDIALDERLRRPTLVLVSDLDDDPVDLSRLRGVLTELQRRDLPLRVVSLNASPEDERFFRRAAPGGDIVAATLPGKRAGSARRAGFPIALAVAAVVAALLLAAVELLFRRLEWGRT